MAMEFSTRSMKNLIKENTSKRVSQESAEALGSFLDTWGQEVVEEARQLAEDDGRKTLRAEDIREALRDRKEVDIEEEMDI
ncbi:MAG: histone [Candidatus Nanohaloarchaea archaeon]